MMIQIRQKTNKQKVLILMIAELYLAYKEKCHKLFLTKKTANKNFKINRRKYTLQLQNEFVLLKNELRRYQEKR